MSIFQCRWCDGVQGMTEIEGQITSTTWAMKPFQALLLLSHFGTPVVWTLECPKNDESITDQKLPLDAYKILPLPELRECVFACDKDEKCQSYNYHLVHQKCYLIDTNRHFTNVSLVDEMNWIHSDDFWHPCTTHREKCYGRPCTAQGTLFVHYFYGYWYIQCDTKLIDPFYNIHCDLIQF